MLQAESAYGMRKRIAFCAQVIETLSPRLVLDVGCGTGSNLTRPLAERFPHVRFMGVDSDGASIRYARAAHTQQNLVFAEQGEDGELAAKPDLIIASEVVEHVEDPEGFLAGLRARLPSTGRLIVTLPNGFGPFEAVSLIEALLRLSGGFDALRRVKRSVTREDPTPVSRDTLAISPHISFFSYRRIRDVFGRVGLSIECYRARTFLCGFGFDYLVRQPVIVGWNGRVADRLPKTWVSAWMFLLSSTTPEARPAFTRGAYGRWRRRVNERCWVAAPRRDAFR